MLRVGDKVVIMDAQFMPNGFKLHQIVTVTENPRPGKYDIYSDRLFVSVNGSEGWNVNRFKKVEE